MSRNCETCGDNPCCHTSYNCSYDNNYNNWKPSCFKRYAKDKDCEFPIFGENSYCFACTNLEEETKIKWREKLKQEKEVRLQMEKNRCWSPFDSIYELYYND